MCKHILFNDFNGDNDLQTLFRFVDKTYDKDGFGAIIRDTDNRIHTFKSLDQTHFYMKLGYYVTQFDIKTLVVHHRTSTNQKGLEYAHPFEFQGNYLTHNGVVTVPGNHDTLTTNDSEELLHHLIKTGFDTLAVQGYYSCFILNDKETIVLADDSAPMWTNGRTFSSHKLGKKWKQVYKKRIHIPLDGSERTTFDVEVAPSSYGSEHRSASIGSGYGGSEWFKDWQHDYRARGHHWEDETGRIAFKPTHNPPGDDDYKACQYGSDPITEFFDVIHYKEEEQLAECGSYANMLELIKDIGWNSGIDLTKDMVEEIASYYLERELEYEGTVKCG